MLGDRPMSDPGLGPPVDEQDGSCKKYKDCQKCAKQRFGNECIGEFVKYKYGQTGGEKICENNVDTCKRAICECDLQFAKNHVETKEKVIMLRIGLEKLWGLKVQFFKTFAEICKN